MFKTTHEQLRQRLPSWIELETERRRYDNRTLLDLFAEDAGRIDKFVTEAAGLRVDLSKNFMDERTRDILVKLACDAGLPQAIHDLVSGEMVNVTEQRAAMHTALRSVPPDLPNADEVATTYQRMSHLVNEIHGGQWRGYSGKRITDVVNMGIGGSDLGPKMATVALKPFHTGHIRCHFVSNIDPSNLKDILADIHPETTLFIVASKSFTTLETLHNARLARDWVLKHAGATQSEQAVRRHFVAVSTAVAKATTFGIAEENILPMWDWVGGRYSLWSAIGLPIALAVGMENFNRLRNGGARMDHHFMTAPLAHNMPVMLALLGIWYGHFWNAHTHAVLPYDYYLRLFPSHLQQLDMESSGKGVTKTGDMVDYPTGPIIWGDVGTNGQHSFHQLLHQGQRFIPVDFIAPLKSHHPDQAEQHRHLLANCFSQSQALMIGRSRETVIAELHAAGVNDERARELAPHKVIPGNRPSTMITMPTLDPETLGALIALYEHRVYVQSVIWHTNAFDQWGVELGKQLSEQLFNSLEGQECQVLDPSTAALVRAYRHHHSTGQ